MPLYLLLLLILSSISCQGQFSKSNFENNRNKILATDIISLPDSLLFNKLGKEFGLADISNGFDSINLRIWLWGKDSITLFNIENEDGISQCTIIDFKFEYLNDDSIWLLIKNKFVSKQPFSGWNSVYSRMNNYGICKDPKNSELNKAGFHNEGRYSISFEIGELNKYIFYEIIDPSYYKFAYKEAHNAYSFLMEMNSQFNRLFYKPVDNLQWKPQK